MYVNSNEIRVRYVETDQMGVVHHSNYYHWFEEARGDFLEKIGFSYSKLEEGGLLIPLVESNCRYKIGAKYGDVLEIKTKITDIKIAKVVFEYEVIRKVDNITLAYGKTIHGFVDKNFRIMNLEKNNNSLYIKLKELSDN